MSPRVVIRHRLEQRFERSVSLSPHWLRLRPAPHVKAEVEAYSLRILTEPHFFNWVRDPFENYLGRLDLPEPVTDLTLDLEIIATLHEVNPFDFLVEPYATHEPFAYPAQLRKELAPYLGVGRYGPRLESLVADVSREPRYALERLDEINRLIHARLPASAMHGEPGFVAVEEVLAKGSGTPWEVAWILTLVLRALGLAARFTSGYHVFLSADRGALPDALRLHAWSEVYLPGAGWIGLDPATGTFAGEGHIPLASAPDPLRALPLAGYCEACDERTTMRLDVQRLEARAEEWPLSRQAWADLRAVANHVDADLHRQDLHLATDVAVCFVSAYNGGLPEWSNTALGADKRQLAEALLERIAGRIAPGAVRHEGQSDWFSGEALPRWRLGCFYRSDGVPVVTAPEMTKTSREETAPGRDDMLRFAERLAQCLGVDARYLLAAHEDVLHELWVNRSQFTFTPGKDDLHDATARHALAQALSASRAPAVGYVLPLRWDSAASRWASGAWRFRREGLYLTPGASPIGYRLPLESLPVGEQRPLDADPERCQFDERPVLAELVGETSSRYTTVSADGRPAYVADNGTSGGDRAPRTAVCVELRGGCIAVFLPPLTHLEHYLELINIIDVVAAELQLPVMLHGYEPPEDHRLQRLTLEPDAGALKVWLPRADSFAEQNALLDIVYAEAAALGLRGERVASDGRRSPPGAVAEVMVGGDRPERSPFLLRPELLRSLIAYWLNHPSLSYFFAGRFIGPGSNAPRPDEGRDDALYELGIGLERIPAGESPRPWVPDRLLRHLLADATGDMRRAEIRIDELYAPDRPGRRLGRVALRSCETSADPKLAALPLLLVRALIGFFAHQPQSARLTPWKDALHDRFMLPQVLWDDLGSVVADVQGVGYPLQQSWFRPLFDLRFPLLGRMQLREVALEIRAAHEPWPLLAEEVTGGGVARFVDVATDRVQVSLTGITAGRHALVCNGKRVPLRETGVRGEGVAGVRYKVWNPPATLHPTIAPVHSLDFDVIDTWTGRVLGGAVYFPPRPGVWGPAGLPPLPRDMEEGRRRDERMPAQIAIPAYTSSGLFAAKKPEVRYAVAPEATSDPRYPYLLDLTRRT